MITTLRLRNFKAFEDTGCIELKPITVLAGPNSSGKSSILQSILLLKQTLEAEQQDLAINLDGRFLHFSKLSDLTFGKPALDRCAVTYEIEAERSVNTSFIERYYPEFEFPEVDYSPKLKSNTVLSFKYREVEHGRRQVVLHHFNMRCALDSIDGPELTLDFRKRRHLLKLRGTEDQLRGMYQRRRITHAVTRYFFPLHLAAQPARGEREEGLSLFPLPLPFRRVITNLGNELENLVEYLGPLREEPHGAYLHSGSPYLEIGRKGEYAAQTLWIEKDREVLYLRDIHSDPEELKLLDAVRNAFLQLGIDHPIDVRSVKSIIYQILCGLDKTGRGRQVTIADVGFGVSQLLPIVVMGLRAPINSLLLFEQPEIHLHPRLQANLADFFITLALLNKRLVIETHSQFFINRLRRRIAEDNTDILRNRVNILFTRPPQNGNGATVEPLRIDEYGIIENWPEDFLPEPADEAAAILRAGLEKRKR